MINEDIDLLTWSLTYTVVSRRLDAAVGLWMPYINELGRRLIVSHSPRHSLTVEVDACIRTRDYAASQV
jgi:hypothetical protein